MYGSREPSEMVTGAVPGRSKSMVMSPASSSASVMAARSVQCPSASAQMPSPLCGIAGVGRAVHGERARASHPTAADVTACRRPAWPRSRHPARPATRGQQRLDIDDVRAAVPVHIQVSRDPGAGARRRPAPGPAPNPRARWPRPVGRWCAPTRGPAPTARPATRPACGTADGQASARPGCHRFDDDLCVHPPGGRDHHEVDADHAADRRAGRRRRTRRHPAPSPVADRCRHPRARRR